MHEEFLIKIAEAEIKLDFKFPASLRRFLASLDKWENQFKDQTWYFNIVHDILSPEKINRIVDDSRSFREEWGLNGVLIAHNGIGDKMLILPEKNNPEVFGEMLYVLWHETAQIRILSWDINTAVKTGIDKFIFGDEFVYSLDEDGTLTEGYELRRLEDPEGYIKYLKEKSPLPDGSTTTDEAETDPAMILYDRLSLVDNWIDEERTDRIGEILSILNACIEEGSWSGRAHLFLNRIYMKGFGVPVNSEKAIYHAKKSAVEGNYNAMSDLSFYYFSGMGAQQNFQTALYWMEKANEKREGMFDDKLELIRKAIQQSN